MGMNTMDNSADDPVQGYVHDVTYILDIPVVVKWEKADDEDDLQIVRVMPATKNIIDVLKVKTEKTTPPTSPKKSVTGETSASSQQKETTMAPDKDPTEDSVDSGNKDNITAPNKDPTEDSVDSGNKDNITAPNKDATEDGGASPQEDDTEETDKSEKKVSTPQKVKPKSQKTLGTTNTTKRRLRSHKT